MNPKNTVQRLQPLFTAALLVSLATACAAKRILHVESVPPGASVLFNGSPIGRTPLDYEYLHYGTVRVSLQLDGYHTRSEQLELKPRWWSRFPMDILTEVFLPIGWVDKRLYRVTLEAGKDRMDSPLRQSVLDRAEALRSAGPEGPRSLPERIPAQAPPMPEEDDQR